MDRLLPQLQDALTQAGQRRTALLRIVESRAAVVAAGVAALGSHDAHDVPAVSRWLASARQEAAQLASTVRAWDVQGARGAEAALNALADEVAGLRQQLTSGLSRAEDDVAAHEQSRRTSASRLAEQRRQVDESNGVWGLLTSGWPMVAGLSVAGALAGMLMAALVLGTGTSATWYGVAGLASPLVLGLLGGVLGFILGAARRSGIRKSAIAEAARVERDVVDYANAVTEAQERATRLRSILAWFTLSV